MATMPIAVPLSPQSGSIADSSKPTLSALWLNGYVEDTQSDFNTGTLSNVTANSDGSLKLTNTATTGTEDFEDATYVVTLSGAWAIGSTAHTGTKGFQSTNQNQGNTTCTGYIDFFSSAGNASIWYFVSSEASFDKFTMSLDGTVLVNAVSGNLGWQQASFAVTYGSHRLTLSYSKDGSANNYSDTAAVDDFVFPSVNYSTTGSRVSNPIPLYGTATNKTTINWNSSIPNGCSIAVKCVLTSDNVTAPLDTDYLTATSGSMLPGTVEGQSLDGKYLWIKEELATSSNQYTPSLQYLAVLADTSGTRQSGQVKIDFDIAGSFNSPKKQQNYSVGGTNLALNKPTTSNGSTFSNGTFITDGVSNDSSKYADANAAAGTARYVQIDLGQVYAIGKTVVWHYYADGRTYYNTKTEASADGVTWTTIFDSAVSGTYAETSAGKTTTFTPINARYVRDWVKGSTANDACHWVEIQVFSADVVPTYNDLDTVSFPLATDLTMGQYFWRVKVISNSIDSGWSTTQSFTYPVISKRVITQFVDVAKTPTLRSKQFSILQPYNVKKFVPPKSNSVLYQLDRVYFNNVFADVLRMANIPVTLNMDTYRWVVQGFFLYMDTSRVTRYGLQSMGTLEFETELDSSFTSNKQVLTDTQYVKSTIRNEAGNKVLPKGLYANTFRNPVSPLEVEHNLDSHSIFVQLWSGGKMIIPHAIAKDSLEPNNKLFIEFDGTPSELQVIVLGIPTL